MTTALAPETMTAADILEDVRARLTHFDDFESVTDDEMRALAWLLKNQEDLTADVREHLGTTIASLFVDLVGDRAALMDAARWTESTAQATETEPPSIEDSNALSTLLTQVLETESDALVTLPAAELLPHVQWYHAVRNFVTIENSTNESARSYHRDAIFDAGRTLYTHHSVERLAQAAAAGHILGEADLRWALDTLGRIRKDEGVDLDETPPCLRDL